MAAFDIDLLGEAFSNMNLKQPVIKVNEHTDDPDGVWSSIGKNFSKKALERLPLDAPLSNDKIRIVCISDTHGKEKLMAYPLKDLAADILIHAGDLTMHGTENELIELDEYFGSLKNIPHKICIAGNHDYCLDERYNNPKRKDAKLVRSVLKNCNYLQDGGIQVLGLNIYGSPWQPRHGSSAFQTKRGENLLKMWNLIPNGVDILITHGPPLGYGDMAHESEHVGCVELLNTVRYRVKPKFHIFGHIHEDNGIWAGNKTIFVNASICVRGYRPKNAPILLDVDAPDKTALKRT